MSVFVTVKQITLTTLLFTSQLVGPHSRRNKVYIKYVQGLKKKEISIESLRSEKNQQNKTRYKLNTLNYRLVLLPSNYW